jgi:chromosome segregation ATPase
MEKSNLRARRNGNGPEKVMKPPFNDERDEFVPETPGAGADSRPQAQGGTATLDRSGTRGIQDTFLDERNDVLAVINELEDQLDRQQEIRESMERDLTGNAEKLQTANQRVQELEWQVVTLQTRVDALEQLRNDVATLEEELADASARAQRTGEQLGIVDKERARLKTELKAANKQIDELWPIRKERDSLQGENKLLSAKVEELEKAQRDTFEERGNLQSQIQELQINLEETTNERNKAQNGLRIADDRIRELTAVQEALDDKIESLRAEKKNLQVQITHLERENSRLVEQRQFYECEVTALRNQTRTAETALASVKKAFSEVRVALTETKSRARRRTLDTWPRIGSTLRGIEQSLHGEIADAEAADAQTGTALTAANESVNLPDNAAPL